MRSPLRMFRDLMHVPGQVRECRTALADLSERVEFVRRELFFEMKYGRSERLARQEGIATPRIVDAAKVEAAREGVLRLNVGCGHVALPGYVNVDMREVPGVDVVASVNDLPFEDGTVAEIRSSHVLEHFPQEMAMRDVLPHWRSKLAPGGTVRAIVPDGRAMLDALAAGSYAFGDFREVLFGAQDYEGDFHYNMFTPDSMADMLRLAGYVDVAAVRTGDRNGKCYEFEMTAAAPPQPTRGRP